jgi:hypothetical protein
LNFLVVQNIRDAYLLESFVQVFGCGSFSIVEKSGIARFAVLNFSQIVENIIPLFEEYFILGAKAKDFEDFIFFYPPFLFPPLTKGGGKRGG